jgi:hypothetical protein
LGKINGKSTENGNETKNLKVLSAFYIVGEKWKGKIIENVTKNQKISKQKT